MGSLLPPQHAAPANYRRDCFPNPVLTWSRHLANAGAVTPSKTRHATQTLLLPTCSAHSLRFIARRSPSLPLLRLGVSTVLCENFNEQKIPQNKGFMQGWNKTLQGTGLAELKAASKMTPLVETLPGWRTPPFKRSWKITAFGSLTIKAAPLF